MSEIVAVGLDFPPSISRRARGRPACRSEWPLPRLGYRPAASRRHPSSRALFARRPDAPGVAEFASANRAPVNRTGPGGHLADRSAAAAGPAALAIRVECADRPVPVPRGRPRLSGCSACDAPSRFAQLKSQIIASIIGGTLERYGFNPLADEIYIAAGRPTREQLRLRQEHKKRRGEQVHSGGLTAGARFQAIARGLERLLRSWGADIPFSL